MISKKFFPYLFIIATWLIFVIPYFLFSKTPFPSEYQVNFFSPWSSYPELASPYKNGAIPDVISQIYPWKKLTIDTLKSGQIPLWNPNSFSGTPHLANYQSAVFSPINILFLAIPFPLAWNIAILLQPLFAGLFMYGFVRSLRFSTPASLLASVSFMFCGFLVSWMPYGTLGYAILFLPLAFAAVEKYFETEKSRYLVLLTLTMPLSFFSGHFQTSLYFLLATLAYIFYKLITTKKVAESIYLFLAIGFGLLVSGPQLLPSISLYSQSLRSTLFQAAEAIPWGYIPTIISPDFFGNPVTRNDWFGHYAEWNAYFGMIPLIFAVYAVSKIKDSRVLFFVILAASSILLAFESPVLQIVIALKIPVLSTSAASRVIVIFSFAGAILSAFGFDYFLQDIKRKKQKILIYVLGFFACIFVVLWAIVIFKLFIPQDKITIARSNLFLPTGLFICSALLTYLFAQSKRWKYLKFVLMLLLLLTVFDMLRFVTKWMPRDSQSLVYAQTGVVNYFPKISGYNRVFGPFGAEDSVYYSLPSTEGYDAVYLRRYGQFISAFDLGKPQDNFRSVVAYPKNGKYSLTGANFLGITYFIHKISDAQNVWEFPFWKYDPSSIKLLFDDGRYQVLKNTNALPRAFLVNSTVVEKTPQKIINAMFNSRTNLRTRAVVEEGRASANLASGSAKILSYEPNTVVVKTDAVNKSFLVLTDSYDPGWQATIDGTVTKLFRTNYSFRGVYVPKGSHTVEFVYKPLSFTYGVITAIIGAGGLLALVYALSKTRKSTH